MLVIQIMQTNMRFFYFIFTFSLVLKDCHKPTFNKGVVVKINANQRYATSAVTHSIFKIIAESAEIPIQVLLKFIFYD